VTSDRRAVKAFARVPAGKTPGNPLAYGLILLFVVVPALALGGLVVEHERVAEWAVSLVPPEQERKLGEFVFEQHKARLRLVEGPAQAMVRDIGAKLSEGSRYPYSFYVARDPTVNAFAVPGGFVVMHTGLLELAQTAEEVAGVLAHEVSHVEKRHSLKAMAKSLGLSATVALLFGDLGGLAALGTDLVGLKFSRDHEHEADREGFGRLVAAGIRPAGMRDFFRRMAEKSSPDLGFLSTHPAGPERLAAIDALLKSVPAREFAPLPYDYAAVKAAIK
jgi:predicted Zn-dependent protease